MRARFIEPLCGIEDIELHQDFRERILAVLLNPACMKGQAAVLGGSTLGVVLNPACTWRKTSGHAPFPPILKDTCFAVVPGAPLVVVALSSRSWWSSCGYLGRRQCHDRQGALSLFGIYAGIAYGLTRVRRVFGNNVSC